MPTTSGRACTRGRTASGLAKPRRADKSTLNPENRPKVRWQLKLQQLNKLDKQLVQHQQQKALLLFEKADNENDRVVAAACQRALSKVGIKDPYKRNPSR